MFSDIYDLDNLYDAFCQIRSVSVWKEETQRYEINLVPNLMALSNSIKTLNYYPKIPRGFIYVERGKSRYIESRTVDDRIVQRVVHNVELAPAIKPRLIYDNAASLENKGVDFFRRRLVYHLKRFASKHGNNGYILILDFRKFFDNIWHYKLIEQLQEIIQDKSSMEFITMLILSNAVDVSYMTDAEYANCMNVPFDNLDYRLKVMRGEIKCTGEKFMHKAMGIGSQISQDAGLFYPHKIDNFCKIVESIEGMGRYMDDSYVIHESKDYLWYILDCISKICAEHGIFINTDKTQIVNLKHEFSILKTRYLLHPNGHVTIMPNNDTFVREKRKLNKQAEELVGGLSKITYDMIDESYRSWRGNILQRNNGSVVLPLTKMDEHYNSLFIDPFIAGAF